MGGTVESIIKGALTTAEEHLPQMKKSAAEFFGPIADKWIKRGSSVVSRLGQPGEHIVNGLNGYEAKARQLFGEYTVEREKLFNQIPKDNTDVLHNYEEYFTGKKQTTHPAVQRLIQFDKMTNLAAYGRAQKAGIPVGAPNPDDWSRIWPRGAFEGKERDGAIQHLIKTGQAQNEKAAERILDFMAGQSKGLKDPNLVTARKYDLPGYRKDVMAHTDSMQRKLRSVAYAETFGPKGEMMDELLSQIRRGGRHTDYKLADKYVDVFMKKHGVNYKPTGVVEQGVNSLMAARYLGRTVIKHLEKPMNVVLFSGGPKAALAGLRDMVVDYGNANGFAIRSGAAMSQTLNDVRTMYDTELARGSSWVTRLTGLNTFDRLSRVFAANAGKHLAQDLAEGYIESKSPALARKLTQLGIDPERVGEGLSEHQLMTAAQRTSDVTQFVYNPNSLPMAWRDSPYTRMLTQFKPYPYIMGNFLKDHVIKPAMQGDLKPLMYFTLLFPTVGEVVGDLSNLATFGDLKHRPDSKFIADRLVDNVSYMAGFGLLFDMAQAISSPGETAAWKLVAGPLISEVVDLTQIPKSKHPDEELMRQIPIVGPLLASQNKHGSHRPPNKHTLRGGVITHSLNKIFGE